MFIVLYQVAEVLQLEAHKIPFNGWPNEAV